MIKDQADSIAVYGVGISAISGFGLTIAYAQSVKAERTVGYTWLDDTSPWAVQLQSALPKCDVFGNPALLSAHRPHAKWSASDVAKIIYYGTGATHCQFLARWSWAFLGAVSLSKRSYEPKVTLWMSRPSSSGWIGMTGRATSSRGSRKVGREESGTLSACSRASSE